MRIITGKYKGRRFDIPRSFKARPTTDFAKENIFNVLNGYLDFEGISALDLFAGTGSISLEMLSRGCGQVVSVEMDREHAQFIRNCVEKLQAENHAIVRGDALRYIKSARPDFRTKPADRRRNFRFGTRQAARFFPASPFCGAQGLRKRQFLDVQAVKFVRAAAKTGGAAIPTSGGGTVDAASANSPQCGCNAANRRKIHA